MNTHPFVIFKNAGWALDAGGTPANALKAWSRTDPIVLRKGESSIMCSPTDGTATFRICKRGQCEDFVVRYDDESSLRKLSDVNPRSLSKHDAKAGIRRRLPG